MMNWGYRITLLYVGFVAMIITMVSLTMREKVDLVDKNYYQKELEFQSKLDKMNRANALEEKMNWRVSNDAVVFTFPEGEIGGTILFFRPSDSAKDRKFTIQADETGKQTISKKELASGLYKVEVDWSNSGQTYFNEGMITIN